MPIPVITPQIASAGLSVELGFSLLSYMGSRTAPAKSGNGTNYFFDFEAVCGPQYADTNKGRHVTFLIYGPNLETFEDTQALFKQMMCALTDSAADDLVGIEVKDEQIAGKKCWADIQERTSDGKVYKDFKLFTPENQPPF